MKGQTTHCHSHRSPSRTQLISAMLLPTSTYQHFSTLWFCILPCSCEMNQQIGYKPSRARILSSFCSSLYLHPLVYLTHNRHPITISQVCYKLIPLGSINRVKSKFPYSQSFVSSSYLLRTEHRCWVTLPQLMKKGMHLLILLEQVSWFHEPSLALLYLSIWSSDFVSVQ